MAIPKLPKDAKRLAQDHRALLKALEALLPMPGQYRREVETAVEAVMDWEVQRILGEIPVEELNRDKRGIRVKTLRDAGYETVADLTKADVRRLTALNGISPAGAAEIHSIVRELASQARQGIRIRISADRKTPEASALLRALLQVMGISAPAQTAIRLLNGESRNIHGAIAAMEPGKSGFSWLFASGEKKQRAHEGYRILYEAITGPYGTEARQAAAMGEGTRNVTNAQAWEAFANRPIPFFNTLESICPGVLGNDDSVYGLPEELAKAIGEEPFYPEGLRCQLRRYQEWGVRYILHQKRVLLGDEMGLGKTVQAIAAMVSLRNTGETRFLVVCPASVIENWCREIKKHSDLPVLRVHGDHRQEALDTWRKAGGVAVTTYETTGIFELPEDFTFSLAVVDEAHYIKNPEAQRTEHVKTICAHTDRLLFMTGTALENKVEEMISLLTVLQPPIAEKVRGMASLTSAPLFRIEVAPAYYRRKREDVLTELPELIETEEWSTLGREEKRVYEDAVLCKQFAKARRVSWNVDNPAQSSKAQRLLELAEEARSDGRKVIVFSFFLDTIDKVMGILGDRCLPPINGSVPPQQRQEIVDAFDKAPAGAVLPAQIQAGGTGLNIQSASVVILCEPQFKPSIENQAISRAYRMGQTRNVLVYRLLCEDTVDERILELLAAKQQAFDAFADDSAVARESLELDQKGFGAIMEAEKKRIEASHALEVR